MLDGCESLLPGEADVAHMADVEHSDPGANSVVLGHDAPHRGVLDRHVPAVKLDHLGAHLAMDSVQRGFTGSRRSRLNGWQVESSIRRTIAGLRSLGTHNPITWFFVGSNARNTGSGLWALGSSLWIPVGVITL